MFGFEAEASRHGSGSGQPFGSNLRSGLTYENDSGVSARSRLKIDGSGLDTRPSTQGTYAITWEELGERSSHLADVFLGDARSDIPQRNV